MNGLILAGGHSRRMGRPKSLLEYHGKPQFRHVSELLSEFCERVFVSCRAEQKTWFEHCTTLLDSMDYGDIGPMNGVLSAFDLAKNEAWFVLGCDYPFLEKSDLAQLAAARNPDVLATVFLNADTQSPEPLIGIYEPASGPLLQDWFTSGNQSLRRFLEQHQAKLVSPQHPEHLKSVDTPEECENVRM